MKWKHLTKNFRSELKPKRMMKKLNENDTYGHHNRDISINNQQQKEKRR